MSYKLTKKNSPNFGYPTGTKNQNKPTMIVIHHWGATGQNFNNVVNWLCNKNAYVSAHYVAMGGNVCQLLDLSSAGWHAGKMATNKASIGIECRPECTNADFETVAELIADIWKQVGKKLPLKGHRDIVATACPGMWYAKLGTLKTRAEYYYNKKYATASKPATTTTTTTTKSFKVKVTISDLWIRAGAGTNTAKKRFIPKGVYTIVETKNNGGYEWGKLKSGEGWIALNYTTKL